MYWAAEFGPPPSNARGARLIAPSACTEEEEEEDSFKADAVNEEDPERDQGAVASSAANASYREHMLQHK